MNPKSNSKRALVSSIMVLIICAAMLLGTTFAWFTDIVSNSGNRIKTGHLEINLLMDKNKDGDYVDEGENISDGTTGDIFSEATGNGILWEPGKTEIVFLQVENTGSLAVKYDMLLKITNVTADAYKLTDVLDYAIIDGMTSKMYNDLYVNTGNTSWTDILNASGVQTGGVVEGEITAAPNGRLLAKNSDFMMVAVHMDEDATNEYMDKEAIIDIQIDATQLPSESDSFGSDYDAAASVHTVDLVMNGDLQDTSALNNWKDTGYLNSGWVRNNENVTLVTDDATGNIYTSHVGNGASIYQRFTIEDSTKEYTLSVDINKADTTGKALINIMCYDEANEKTEKKYYYYENMTTNGWATVVETVQLPRGTTFIDLWVRSLSNERTAICFDNIKLTYQE